MYRQLRIYMREELDLMFQGKRLLVNRIIPYPTPGEEKGIRAAWIKAASWQQVKDACDEYIARVWGYEAVGVR